ncbi:hypothetical protein TNCV_93651 [Trichonephila clavipes]|nr:hypothetical protein TNCV_93651 [Trichonephila clavipes]
MPKYVLNVSQALGPLRLPGTPKCGGVRYATGNTTYKQFAIMVAQLPWLNRGLIVLFYKEDKLPPTIVRGFKVSD